MMRIRRALDRGHANHGWLDAWHTFSFAAYQDPHHVRFRSLRVMNEDRVAPGGGFDMHPHHDMEIITYVLAGTLEHRDSLGNGEILRANEFQRMSAGTGIVHSEFNPSATTPLHLYQIWILPDTKGITPDYEQRLFPQESRCNQLQLVASRDATAGSMRIHQDANIYLADLKADGEICHHLNPARYYWLQVLRGTVACSDSQLLAGDGLAISSETLLTISTSDAAEIMLFDLA
jgi:redox-sensitive bicupin YhaK (pirin superfamily)